MAANRRGRMPSCPHWYDTNRTVTDLFRDFLYSLRLIRKAPLFSLYVIAPLALGIGLNGAIFMLLDAFLLRPLPVKNPANLVRVVQVVRNLDRKSTRLNSSHQIISYAVFCLKKKK